MRVNGKQVVRYTYNTFTRVYTFYDDDDNVLKQVVSEEIPDNEVAFVFGDQEKYGKNYF